MNKDIKEILDYCNKYINDKYMQYSEPMLNAKSLKIILDYITELQTNLKNMLDDNIDNTNKIRKAIEYIKEQSRFTEGCDIYKICNKEILLNILQGDDKE